ncbi:hypothetical protein V8E36_002417 [Tilletia maclaganii]
MSSAPLVSLQNMSFCLHVSASRIQLLWSVQAPGPPFPVFLEQFEVLLVGAEHRLDHRSRSPGFLTLEQGGHPRDCARTRLVVTFPVNPLALTLIVILAFTSASAWPVIVLELAARTRDAVASWYEEWKRKRLCKNDSQAHTHHSTSARFQLSDAILVFPAMIAPSREHFPFARLVPIRPQLFRNKVYHRLVLIFWQLQAAGFVPRRVSRVRVRGSWSSARVASAQVEGMPSALSHTPADVKTGDKLYLRLRPYRSDSLDLGSLFVTADECRIDSHALQNRQYV